MRVGSAAHRRWLEERERRARADAEAEHRHGRRLRDAQGDTMTVGELMDALAGVPRDTPVRLYQNLRLSVPVAGLRLKPQGDWNDGMVSFPEGYRWRSTGPYVQVRHGRDGEMMAFV
jgi:hypothetical protein